MKYLAGHDVSIGITGGQNDRKVISRKAYIHCRIWMVIAILCAFCLPEASYAVDNKVAKFTIVTGSVDALREQQDAPVPAVSGMGTYLKDIVRTKRRSRTQMKFIDDSVLNMGPNYMVKIEDYVYDEKKSIRKAILSSLRGTVHATVSKLGGDWDSTFEIRTPTAVASVRGTDFIVKVNSDNETEVVVIEGAVSVRNINRSIHGLGVMVRAGQHTIVHKNKPPSKPSFIPAQMVALLVKNTTPSTTVAPVAPPPPVAVASVPIAATPPAPVVAPPKRRPPPVVHTTPASVPPVQPPITTTVPALITVPVQLKMQF